MMYFIFENIKSERNKLDFKFFLLLFDNLKLNIINLILFSKVVFVEKNCDLDFF